MQGRKLFFVPMGCLVLLSIACVVAYSGLVRTWLMGNMETSLINQASYLTKAIQRDSPLASTGFLNSYLDQTGTIGGNRVTLIHRNGKVIADSSLNLYQVEDLGDHSQREEVQEALVEGIGIATRESETLGHALLYVAKPVSFDGFDGVLRIAMPLTLLEGMVNELDVILAALLSVVVLMVAALAYLTSRMVQQQVHDQQESLENHVQARTKEIELLQRLANMLAACNTLEEANHVVADVLPRLLGEVNGAVSMIRSSRNQLEVKLDWGGKWPGANSFAPDECWALRKGKHHLANDQYSTLPCQHMQAVNDDQTLCVPLIAHGNTIGLMHLYIGEKQVDEEWQQLAFTVAEHLGLALANLNLQEKLRDQAVRDPLTGLHNRRYLEESIDKEFMRARRHQQHLSILMADMDHFKRFNDNFGHDAGDYVLKALAGLLVETLRRDDLICRIGGEEIAIVLPDADQRGAIHLANKLCAAVRDLDLSFNAMSLGKLSLSVGIATFPEDSTEPDALLKAADSALYAAKDQGRDRAVHVRQLAKAAGSEPAKLVGVAKSNHESDSATN